MPSIVKPHDTESKILDLDKTKESKFLNKIVTQCAIVGIDIKSHDEDFERKKDIVKESIASLEIQDSLQAMLATQMTAVHDLQQDLAFYATHTKDIKVKAFYINSVTKLSNVFIQQASLLNKLKGNGQQKVCVEHVHVYSGGQAVVGNVENKISTPRGEG